mmetsp:Transcript_637/g.1871  ORF Transcript_637/g.1871 Transcript_637/m.1871 type:complete len:148 (-) Transcript_637:2-445(-)
MLWLEFLCCWLVTGEILFLDCHGDEGIVVLRYALKMIFADPQRICRLSDRSYVNKRFRDVLGTLWHFFDHTILLPWSNSMVYQNSLGPFVWTLWGCGRKQERERQTMIWLKRCGCCGGPPDVFCLSADWEGKKNENGLGTMDSLRRQ